MFKKKISPLLLALLAVVLLPTVALAQTDDSVTYDNSLTDWEYTDYDWSDYYNDSGSTEYDEYEKLGAMITSASAGVLAIWASIVGLIALAFYVYISLAYMKIAKKLNHPNPWFAWVPILNTIQLFQLADMSGWFVLLLCIPIVNVVLPIIALMKICEKRGMDKLLGLLALIPLGAFVLIGILAWKKDENVTPTTEATTPAEKTE
jgi:hypothetical protein